MTMKRDDKVQIIRDLLADGQGRFSVTELLVKAGSERRALSGPRGRRRPRADPRRSRGDALHQRHHRCGSARRR